MDKKIVTYLGIASALIQSALTVAGFIPMEYAPYALLVSAILSAVGRRISETASFGNSKLTAVLVVVTIAGVVGSADFVNILPASVSTFIAGVGAIALAFAKSALGWDDSSNG